MIIITMIISASCPDISESGDEILPRIYTPEVYICPSVRKSYNG